MTISSGTRINVTRWSSDSDAMTRQQFDDTHQAIDAVAAKYKQGLSGTRPDANNASGGAGEGAFFFNTSTSTLSYSSGASASSWFDIVLQGQTISTNLTFGDGVNIVAGTGTGTKIGTATSQKIGFFNATPVVQQINTTTTRTALVNLGLIASGGDTRLDFMYGTTRPSSPTAGQHFYNATQLKLEYYTGTAWVGVVPTGTIAPFYGTTAPTGWLFCDGSAISTDYSDLRTLVGTTTPDLRSKTLTGRASTGSAYSTGGDAALDASIDLVLVPTATSYTPVTGDVIGTLIDDNTDLTKVPPTGYINWIIKT